MRSFEGVANAQFLGGLGARQARADDDETSACSSRSPSRQAQELLARARVVTNEPVQRRGHGLGARLLQPGQRHAWMLGRQIESGHAVLVPA